MSENSKTNDFDSAEENNVSDRIGKWINDPEVLNIYQQVVNRCEEIKEMLEDKRQKTVEALNDYTTDIVDQFREQLIPKLTATFEREDSSSSSSFASEDYQNEPESSKSYDSGVGLADSSNKQVDELNNPGQCNQNEPDIFQTPDNIEQSNLAIESSQPDSSNEPHPEMVLQAVDKMANLLHGLYSVD